MPSKDQDGLFGEMHRDLVGSDRWDRYYATGGVVPPPLPPPSRSVRERFSPLQALANFEPLYTAMREVANIGMSTDEVANAVSILANQTPRPTIRMIRFRKE